MSSRILTALGTSSQVPTRERNHNGYFLRWDTVGFLFDPGEGTQRQMIFSNVAASAITHILITHLHGDHCLGLAGVLQRLSLDGVAQVRLFYPASGARYIENLKNASIYYNTTEILDHPITDEGVIYEGAEYRIETARLDHTVESWGYRIQEKDSVRMLPDKLAAAGISGREVSRLKEAGELTINGKTVTLASVSVARPGQSMAFVMDTRMCDGAIRLAQNADLLVCESTYLSSEESDAVAHGHLTAAQAANIARQAKAVTLALTHFSQRYKTIDEFLIEARAIHGQVVVLRDGDTVEMPRRR